MKKSRFSEEQVIGVLKEHESGVDLPPFPHPLIAAPHTWFRQLDLAPFDALIWPHPEGMGLVIPRGPWRKEPVGRLEPRPARGASAA